MRVNRRLFGLLFGVFLLGACSSIPGFVSEADYEFEQGLAFFNRGQYREAIPRFQRATDLDPNFGRAYLYLGRSHVSLKNWRQALSPLRTAYRLAPQETKNEALDVLIDALFAVGLDAFKSGDFLESIGYFREMLGLQPSSTRGKTELVRSLIAHGGDSLAKGNISQAISSYSEAVQSSPNSFEAVFGLAKAFFRNGDYSKAFQTAQDALRVDPSNRDLQFFLRDLPKR